MDTEVTSFLDANGIPFRKLPHSRKVFTCEEASEERGVPIEEMVKCVLLVDKKKRFFLACLPGDKQLDTQKVRDELGSKRLSFSTPEEVYEVLGFKMGAVSPLCLKTNVPIIFDETLSNKENVNISSGDPTFGLEMKCQDLLRLLKPVVAPITK